jgi:hypothetical protein
MRRNFVKNSLIQNKFVKVTRVVQKQNEIKKKENLNAAVRLWVYDEKFIPCKYKL